MWLREWCVSSNVYARHSWIVRKGNQEPATEDACGLQVPTGAIRDTFAS